ncbi:peptidoglycan DD-metalloendopeptidase family protein [Echinicola sp. CAU 1574]|uniref:Peptidoglycan DD-metalloendopeptidase family protein n=1 Tax=Echinicola arenosa TaxID=2774144 RepID=A0ABR9AJ74_9BACT|nr:peptidoglycan DD-metalloendopeptidase family protein [Echinicola arenosa]MBD8488812.1 peptidoglycan DD-metalloendopeptidase family protein [Echinicola arenosa]
MQKLTQLLKDTSFYPIMGVELNHENTLVMDFTANNTDLKAVDLGDTQAFSEYVFGLLADASCAFGIGGYMEPRAIYQRSEVFGTSPEDFRNIHLGVDIWAEPGQAVYAPLDGKIHSFQDNGAFGNYGPAIILEHQLKGEIFYSLYGHLKRSDLIGLEVGQQILAGQVFCHIGPYPENGDWPPHLHFQLIVDLEGNRGDYPGVCAEKDQDRYQRNCPDPKWIIGFEETF